MRQTKTLPPTIWVDQDKAREHQARKAYRLNTIRFPILRLVGSMLLLAAVLLHNRFILGSFNGRPLLIATAIFLSYCALSWVLLIFAYERLKPFDLGVFFLALDLPLWTIAIYISGADKSWLFFILALRVADQTHTSLRRALVFGHIGTLCYLSMLAYTAFVANRPLAWPEALTKAFFIYSANTYIALAAHTAEGLRRRMVEAIRVARESILRLRQQSEQLEASKQHAEKANQAKGEFLAMISHELRTPMTGVIGTADLLLRTSPSHKQRHYIETIQSSSKALLTIIDEILHFTGMESEGARLHPQTFHLQTLLKEVSSLLSPSASVKGIRIELNSEENIPSILRGDAGRVRQILINLVGNAVKYSDRGPITISVRREPGEKPSGAGRSSKVSASDKAPSSSTRALEEDARFPGNTSSDGESPRPEAVTLSFEIKDFGMGIPTDAEKKIFDPFYQIDSSMSRAHGGTGLGLAIAQRLAHLLGGELGYRSILGEGSTFRLTLTFELPKPSPFSTKYLAENFDLKSLSQLLGSENNDPRLIDQWLLLFLGDCRRQLAKLRRALEQEDLATIDRSATDLRDECSGLGAKSLSLAYTELIDAARNKNTPLMESAFRNIESTLTSIQSHLGKIDAQ